MPQPYTSTLVVTTLIESEDGLSLKPDLPYRTYSFNCVADGVDLTYRMSDMKNLGKEVLCKVDYRSAPHKDPTVLVETDKAEAFAGNLGNDWKAIQTDVRYTKHYTVTKADSLATYTETGIKVPYDGVDKAEITKFCQFEEKVLEVKPIDELDLKEVTR